MSGHSKWSSIKHKKAATDAKRGQLFTKLAREITVAARGGGDAEFNSNLRLAIQRARDANMPNDNIKRAVERGAGGGDGAQLEEVTYEGYGPGGTAVLIDTLTDNRNRTVADIRAALSRNGGNLAENGAVGWQFQLRGVISVPEEGHDPDEIQLTAIEAGAIDVSSEDGEVEVLTEPVDFEQVRTALQDAGCTITRAELAQLPQTPVQLEEREAVQVLRLLDRLDDLDDVSRVHSNADFDTSVLEAVGMAD